MASVLRDPNRLDAAFMSKRAGWLIVLNLLVPGSAQVLAGSRRLGRFGLAATLALWSAVIVGALLWWLARGLVLTLLTSTPVLWVLAAVAAFYAALWLVLTLDTIRLVRFVSIRPVARGLVGAVAAFALVAGVGTASYAAVTTTSAIGLFDAVLGGGDVEPPIDGRYNILLIGGDAGPDRTGMRPDSISVASVDAETGGIVLMGIPRNLYHAPFSEGSPMLGPYPDGWNCGDDCLIDYVYSYGQQHPELYPDAKKQGSRPGIEALRDAVEGVLGLTVQYYVLVDMQGFADLVDALGGIEVDVEKRVPLGSEHGAQGQVVDPIGYIEPGLQHMSGRDALWFARSRYGSNDYERMGRQRQVQQAIIAQASPAKIATSFSAVAAAGARMVRTDIPQGMIARFIEIAERSRAQQVVSLDFVPPDWDNLRPDFAAIHAKVQELIVPASPSPTQR